jgi:SAM-dependent methyltransferase
MEKLLVNPTAKCNICGGEEFDYGPNKRLSRTKKLPVCKNCGSAERHRVFRETHLRLRECLPYHLYSCLQISNDLSVQSEWFKNYELSIYGSQNSIDLQQIDRETDSYDIVICNHVLEHVERDVDALGELFRIFNQHGLLQISVPQPYVFKTTNDWGFPDPKQFGHYRMYGRDIKEKFEQVMIKDMVYLEIIANDPVTDAKDMCFIFLKSLGFAYLLKNHLSQYFECEIHHPFRDTELKP